MVKIRLSPTKKGSKNFRIVAIDSRYHNRSGNFLEIIGRYDALKKTEVTSEKVVISLDKYNEYLAKGAQATDAVIKLVKSVLKHSK